MTVSPRGACPSCQKGACCSFFRLMEQGRVFEIPLVRHAVLLNNLTLADIMRTLCIMYTHACVTCTIIYDQLLTALHNFISHCSRGWKSATSFQHDWVLVHVCFWVVEVHLLIESLASREQSRKQVSPVQNHPQVSQAKVHLRILGTAVDIWKDEWCWLVGRRVTGHSYQS